MSDVLVEDLREQLTRGQVVLVVGAGVSQAATGGTPEASWRGLLHNGVEYCEAVMGLGLPPGWSRRLRAQIDSGDVEEMLLAAENVTRRLDGPVGGEFGRWLEQSVGSLRATSPEVIQAIAALDAPIATTNYDNLIEDVAGLPRVTWRQDADVERVMRRDEPGVLHLHGHWRDPASVILGARSYERILGEEHAQGMQRALAMLTSLLFVGFGAGLDDPNFAALRAWLRRARAGTRYRHFRLGRNDELAVLHAQHDPGERIFLVGYGPGHESLPGFLRTLAPAKSSARIALPPTGTSRAKGGPPLVVSSPPVTALSPQEGKSKLLDAIASDRDLYVAMDLGGTKAYVSLMDGDADRLFDKRFLTTSREDPDLLLAFIEACINGTIDEIDKRYAIDPEHVWARVRAIGLAFPGPTDHDRGLILDASNFQIKDFELAEKVEEACHGIPTYVDNDVNLGVLGEAWKGIAQGFRNVIGIIIGTGVGGGIIIEDQIYRGKNKTAGEIGHMILDCDSERKCGCGQRGCFEALASRQAMAKALQERKASRGISNRRWLERNLGSNELADHYKRGDVDAVAVVDEAAGFCGKAVFSILNLFNPEIIVFGGGFVRQVGDRFLKPVRAEAKKCMNAVYSVDEKEIPIVLGALDNPMLVGACKMAMEGHAGRREHGKGQVMSALVRGLTKGDLALLESFYEDQTPVLISGKPDSDYHEDKLRPLRNRGLIQTDGGQSLRKSRYVQITELGRLVVEERPIVREPVQRRPDHLSTTRDPDLDAVRRHASPPR